MGSWRAYGCEVVKLLGCNNTKIFVLVFHTNGPDTREGGAYRTGGTGDDGAGAGSVTALIKHLLHLLQPINGNDDGILMRVPCMLSHQWHDV